ncbi:MAG: FIST N-terminal domain-containing protein, partial [Cyanobacteria bacterium J06649_11]
MIKSHSIQYCNKEDLLGAPSDFYKHSSSKTLIQVFTGCVDRFYIENLLSELKEVFPDVAIVGTTTSGEIVHNKVLENTTVVNITIFEKTTVCSTLVHYSDELWTAGEKISNNLKNSHPKGIILFGTSLANGRTLDATNLLDSIQESLPGVIISGGQAGDNGKGIISYVFSDFGITGYGAVAASLSGEDLSIHNTYNLSWIPIGKKLTITKAKGPRVYSIDNRTPLDLYNHYLGPEVVEGFPLTS